MSQTPSDTDTRREILRDLASGGLFLALAVFLGLTHYRQGGRLHESFGADPGPALLPDILLAALALAGAGLVLRGALATRRHPLATLLGDLHGNFAPLALPLAVVALLLAFLLAHPWTGFGLALAGFAAALAALLARQEGRNPAWAAGEGVLIAAALYALFRFVLSVPLT